MHILVTAKIPAAVISLLAREHQVQSFTVDPPLDRSKLLQSITDKEGLLCMLTDRIDAELLAHAPALQVIANNGAGFDHIDLAAATARGIMVTNTPGVLAESTADLTFALILATARRVVEGDRRTREGKFQYSPFRFLGQDVFGKTLGIIGMGGIGRAVAKRALGFGMRLLYTSRTRLEPAVEQELHASPVPLDTLLREADFVSLHVPLTPQTRRLIGPRELALMQPSAYLINTSRGPVVDEAALVAALSQGKIRGAGLDVYEREPRLSPGLADLENVVLLPHIGCATIDTRTRMAFMAAQNLLAGLRGDRPPNCLNWPELHS